VVNVGDIDKLFDAGGEVNVETLRTKGLAKKSMDGVRILGEGDVTKKLVVKAHHFSKSAKEKIEAKGGTVELIPPPKKPVRNKRKPRPPREQG
jgi:large subunit ribosomal protein L15